MGALTAYRLAATRPDLIRLLVLEEMPPPDPAKPPRPLPRQPEPGADHDWRAVIAVRRWRNDPPKDWWDLAGQIPSKTLVIGGTKSYLPQTRLKELSQPAAERHVQPRSTGATSSTRSGPASSSDVVEPFIAWFAK